MSSWERRRVGELTTEYLGRVLEDYLQLPEMAQRARQGHFDDYFCPPDVDDGMNINRLVDELQRKSTVVTKSRKKRILEVAEAAKQGEFDGTKEESERWAASKEGQDLMKEFPLEVRRRLFGDEGV